MSPPRIDVGWIYFVSEEAGPVLKKFFDSGKARPGAVFMPTAEEFEILKAGIVYLPVHTKMDESRILVPEAG